MKTVFENSMVAHVWANQSQPEGRSHNGNFWFRDRALYSYRTPIAVMHLDKDGARVALLTSESYSTTTQGHKADMRRAVDYGNSVPYFEVPHIGASGGRHRENGADMHGANLAHFSKQYEDTKARLRRARDVYSYDSLREIAETAARYVSVFGVDDAILPDMPHATDTAAIQAFREDRDARLNTPEMRAKREREREKREERKARKEEDARRERFEREAKSRADWLAGVAVYFRGTDENGGALLRIRDENLETSQGASVPLAHAVKAFRMVKRCRDASEQWHRNGHTIRVGHFQVDSIDAAGNMRAGCHRINWPEIERIARAIDVFDAAETRDVSDVLETTAHT
jgi:hypothetical protein